MTTSLDKLAKILQHADEDFIQKSDFKQTFDLIVSMFKEMRVYLEGEMKRGDKGNSQMCMDMMSKIDVMERMMKSKCSMDEMNKAIKGVMAELSSIKATIPTMPDLSVYEGKLSEVEASIKDETPEEVRNKLESIKVESEKLSISAIENLEERLRELKKIRSTGKSYALFGGGGGGSGGGRTVQAYDLSASLNGVLKSFSLPAFWKIVSIHSSSFPYIFRPTVDYTISGTTITFTSEIEATTTLATGQTLLVVYAE